jgi:hypothetical protein
MNISVIFGILSGLFQIFGYVIYAKHVESSKIKPNTGSWTIWTFGSIVEGLSYFYTSDDLIKSILPITCIFCVLFLFIRSTYKGRFQALRKIDWFLLISDILITIIWYLTSNPLLANILFIISSIISFIPIVYSSFKHPEFEDAAPWIIWTVAYFFMCLTVISRWDGLESFLYPLFFVLLHAIVAYLSLDIRKKND